MEISLLELVSAVSSFAALLTAIIVFFTLIEMKRQRQSTYKPNLMFKPVSFSLSASFTDVLQYTISSKGNESSNDKMHARLFSEIYNIGLGSAKNLAVTWTFDYKKSIERIENEDSKLGVSISIDNDFLKIKEKNEMWINLVNDLNQNTDYLLPTSITSEPGKVRIPTSYVHLLSLYFIFCIYNDPEIESPLELKDFPELKMIIKYQDIEEHYHIKKYRIESNYMHIEYKRNNDGNLSSFFADFLMEFRAV